MFFLISCDWNIQVFLFVSPPSNSYVGVLPEVFKYCSALGPFLAFGLNDEFAYSLRTCGGLSSFFAQMSNLSFIFKVDVLQIFLIGHLVDN